MAQSRKWQLTINNPAEKEFDHAKISERLQQFTSLLYYCMCDEVGENETYHTHIYFVLKTPTKHTVIENRIPSTIAHREIARGKSVENRAYILKDGEKYNKQPDGSYEYTDGSGKTHKGTNYSATFEEWGEMPQEQQGKSKDVEVIYGLIKDGASNLEIVDTVPSGMLQIDKIERTRSMLRDSQYADSWRDLEVTYIFGETGTGKTRGVMDKYGYKNCYRVTDYKHPFDSYDGQDVIIFEEYRNQFKIADLLNYLDGYPLLLPCRYFNRQACYTKVFIVTNMPPDALHLSTALESRKALYRRINTIVEYSDDGQTTEYLSLADYTHTKNNRWCEDYNAT